MGNFQGLKDGGVKMKLWGFTLSSHSWFTCCIDLIFQEENMKKSQTIFFAQNSWPPKKKGGKKLGGHFFHLPKIFCAWRFGFFQQILWAACKLAAFS